MCDKTSAAKGKKILGLQNLKRIENSVTYWHIGKITYFIFYGSVNPTILRRVFHVIFFFLSTVFHVIILTYN